MVLIYLNKTSWICVFEPKYMSFQQKVKKKYCKLIPVLLWIIRKIWTKIVILFLNLPNNSILKRSNMHQKFLLRAIKCHKISYLCIDFLTQNLHYYVIWGRPTWHSFAYSLGTSLFTKTIRNLYLSKSCTTVSFNHVFWHFLCKWWNLIAYFV